MNIFLNLSARTLQQSAMMLIQHVVRYLCCLGFTTIAFTAFSPPLLAQSRVILRNFDIVDTLTREAAQFFAKQLRSPLFPQPSPLDTLRIQTYTHEASWMLEQALFSNILTKRRFRASDTTMPHHRLVVRITDLATRYFSCTHDVDALTREISCAAQATLETRDGTTQALEPFSKTYRDTISRRTLAGLENKQYSFTQATIPEAEPNFWKQALEPAIVIIAAGIMVVLFFFVRTQ
jgi:hypothetical protein